MSRFDADGEESVDETGDNGYSTVKAELEKLDQRLPTGSMPACVSPFVVR